MYAMRKRLHSADKLWILPKSRNHILWKMG